MSILREMSSVEFNNYIDMAINSYAQEKIKSGNWTKEEAFCKSKAEYDKLLPNGVNSPNNHLFSILNDNSEVVGMIWINKKDDVSSFIYDINIYEEYQGKGYGLRAMKEIETVAKTFGVEKIELHVFGHNKRAISLYEKLDYKATNILMSKQL